MIQRTAMLGVAVILLASLVGCQSSNRANSGKDVESLAAAKQQFMDVWTKNAGDTWTTAKLKSVLDTSEQFLSFDGMSENKTVIQGFKAYDGIWATGMDGFKTAKLSETTALRTWIDGDVAVTASIVHIQGEMTNGQKLDMPGHLTLGWQRQHANWRVVHEHMSLGVKQ